MLHPALREAGHKWHSSQSCFHVSFLTPKGICRPTTLVALFFPHRLVSITPSREELTLWEWKQVVIVLHIGVKMGTCRIFCSRFMPVYDTVSVSHLLFFWSHMKCLSSRGQAALLICRLQQLARWDDKRLSVVEMFAVTGCFITLVFGLLIQWTIAQLNISVKNSSHVQS